MLLVPLDQDSDLLIQLVIEREPMDLAESNDRQILLQSGVIFIHLLGCVPLTPSFEEHVSGLFAIFVQNRLQNPCGELSPDAHGPNGLQDRLFLASRNKSSVYRGRLRCLFMLETGFLLQWCFVLYNLFHSINLKL